MYIEYSAVDVEDNDEMECTHLVLYLMQTVFLYAKKGQKRD